ncbi:lachesin-like isoform X2 [Ostrea edulis]|uniref:lachesin-like isoform X2 n=1 Tax=Ostrea edulis TaxID=37623 RepID=UPI0024AF064A|nr:lachesin-like isoform X2 [Ostrea edulis]
MVECLNFKGKHKMFTCWNFFFLLVGISNFVDAQRPDIVDEILPEVKQKNQTGYLNCTVVNKGSESVVLWTRSQTVNGGNPILLSEDDKIVYQGNDQGINEDSGLKKYDIQSRINGRRITYMLVIRYLAEEDAGDYLCTIKIQGIEWVEWPKKIGKLTVQVAPKIQPGMNSIYEQNIGTSLQLNCEAHGNPYPNITWRREDGQELPMGGFQSRGSQLSLTDIQRNDRGNYICVADNNVKPPDNFKVELIVFFAPSCRPVQSSVGQAQHRRLNAKLECIVAGYPQPSMVWMKEGENGKRIDIQDDDKYDITQQFSSQLQNDEFWYTLLVKNVQAKDYTKYFCVGNNSYGSGETTIRLYESTFSSDSFSLESSSATISESVSSSDSFKLESSSATISDCMFGDRVLNCRVSECATYTAAGILKDCCETCKTYTVSTPAPNSNSTALPSWVIPAAAGTGGGLLVFIIIVVACCCCRKSPSEEDALTYQPQMRNTVPRQQSRLNQPNSRYKSEIRQPNWMKYMVHISAGDNTHMYERPLPIRPIQQQMSGPSRQMSTKFNVYMKLEHDPNFPVNVSSRYVVSSNQQYTNAGYSK